MAWWIPLAVGAGAGMLQGRANAAQQKRQNLMEAVKTQTSPWTGQTGNLRAGASPWGSILQGAASGAAFGQGLEQHEANMALKDARLAQMQDGGAMGSVPMGGPERGMEEYLEDYSNRPMIPRSPHWFAPGRY